MVLSLRNCHTSCENVSKVAKVLNPTGLTATSSLIIKAVHSSETLSVLSFSVEQCLLPLMVLSELAAVPIKAVRLYADTSSPSS